ncbi:RluA family pseudouridine synthase [Candidatus Saccharibacteria bacterium]|nr:RluA family pseudouridine synthase [Candidatus Saccharibacteria bacterium]
MPRWKVSSRHEGKRLDSFVHDQYPQLSRSEIQKLGEQQKVCVNKIPQKASYKLRSGDQVELLFDISKLAQPPTIELPILYENKDCLVINKPAGILSHSKGALNREATVATFIQPKLTDLEGERAGIVHRLDRGTSGVMIAAKHAQALSWLQKQFAQRKVRKTYYAVVEGHVKPAEAVIDMSIARHPRVPKTFRVSPLGKPAVTQYKVVKTSQHFDLVELRPQTGRTHQLRVHLKQLGHPIVGDILYGAKPADRLYLHAADLELTLRNHVHKTFHVPLPGAFRSMLEADGHVTTAPSYQN